MKKIILLISFISLLSSDILITPFVGSHHFEDRENGKKWNEQPKYIGLEYNNYGVSTFTNSRDKRTYFAWYNFTPFDNFDNFILMAGLQKGYCLDGLESVECTDDLRDYGPFILPTYQNSIYKNILGFIGYSNKTLIYGFKIKIEK